MAKLLKLRRGTTSQHSSFTGAEGEVTVDTTKDTLVVHDGSTAGGTPLAKESTVTAIPAVIDEDNMSTNSATRPPSQQSVKAYVDALPDVIDEDNMSSNSATRPPSQQSVKAYVDALPDVIDEDNLGSDSATRPPSQQSVKAYVDALPDVIDEDNFATNSATRPPSQQSVKALADTKAPLSSPALTGNATGVNLTLSGNLTVNGTTTTVATTNTTLTDNLLELNSGASSNANDSGILIERGSTGDNAIIAWDESADKFTVGTTTGTASSTGNISITTGTIVANVEGNVTGNLTGTASSATNADTVDNLHAASFLRSDANDSFTSGKITITSSDDYPLTFNNSSNAKIDLQGSTTPYIRFRESATEKAFIQWSNSGFFQLVNQEDSSRIRIKDAVDFSPDGSNYYSIWHAGNDGAGSGLDADLLDGKQDTSFLRSDAGGGAGSYAADSDITFNGGTGAVTIGANSDIRMPNGTWTGDYGAKIQHHDNYLYLQGGSSGVALRNATGSRQVYLTDGGAFKPANTQTGYDLGSSSHPWATVYADNFNDSKGDVRKIPRELKSSAYTLVLADAGKTIATNSGVTVPNNVMGTGDAVTIVNNSGSDITITQASSLSMYNAADAATGNRTLAGRGMATVWFASANICYISGAGLS